MKEVREGYDLLVALMEAYRRYPIQIQTRLSLKDFDIIEFGLKLEWLEHQQGETSPMNATFIWTEKAEREISHLDEWE